MENLDFGEQIDIVLDDGVLEYDARVTKSKGSGNLTRIFWGTDLATHFASYENDERQPVLEFKRTGDRRYAIKMILALDASDFPEEEENDNKVQFDHNQILYGPPGTGKTYHTAIYAVAICDGKTIEEVEKDSYNKILERYNELKEEGRIAFTTFHQSYGYEEFIEGIKPKLDADSGAIGYTIEDGIFKRFCKEASL